MMKKYSSKELDNVYHALASTVRRQILTRLVREPNGIPVTTLAAPFDMSLAAISKHIKVLERAGLLKKRRQGTTFYCTAALDPIKSASALVHFFEQFMAGGTVNEENIEETSDESQAALLSA